MYQNFCKYLGYGSKGYSLLNFKTKKTILISGSKSNYKYLLLKLTKILKEKPSHLIIKDERYDLKHIDYLCKKIQKKEINTILVLGGGSIIDFSKRLILMLKKKEKKINFFIFPSLIGSGAEISKTSIINGKTKNFSINEDYLPDGIIYDENLVKSSNRINFLMGILDSITHCIESQTSINKNYYLKFLCNQTLTYFIKKNSFNSLTKSKKLNFLDFCTLSFNGGLAQSNSGSGICHALSHACEEILGIRHSECISYFIIPVLKYLIIKNKKDLKDFDDKIFRYTFRISKFIKKNHNYNKIDKMIANELSINNLINKSKSDICWRLYKNNIDEKLLIQCLKNENYKR